MRHTQVKTTLWATIQETGTDNWAAPAIPTATPTTTPGTTEVDNRRQERSRRPGHSQGALI
ncbi:hypothetical protein [Nonomuraea sp. bgisy101]|uniref:hypothetical protein n=1 Tax=Nonomuraea sp. bgisy101 TaxID=3413784 RepID=UPI003D73365D